MSAALLHTAASLSRDGRPFVLATVVAVEGRTPREAGARMIWLAPLAILLVLCRLYAERGQPDRAGMAERLAPQHAPPA